MSTVTKHLFLMSEGRPQANFQLVVLVSFEL